MKFKLNKAEHLICFALLNKIEKSKLSMRENKAASSSLIFHSIDAKLYVQSENNFCSSKFLLKNVQPTEYGTFGLDISSFFNALNNFPTEEIQFIYNLEENLLIFGIRKPEYLWPLFLLIILM